MSEYDLKIANAAIALGDSAVPPIGSKLRILTAYLEKDREEVWYVNGVNVMEDSTAVYLRLGSRDMGGHLFVLRIYPVDVVREYGQHQIELLSVPDSAPPFEEWERVVF